MADAHAPHGAAPPPPDPRPFVFVTLGTDHHQFQRLVGWVDDWLRSRKGPDVRCLVQTGESDVPQDERYVAYLPYPQLEAALGEADVVVTHAGSGSVLMCRRLGWRPIAVARQSRLGEHVDDHQVEFARHMAAEGYIELAETEDAFRHLVEEALAGRLSLREPASNGGAGEVVDRFGRLVEDLVRSPRPRRWAPGRRKARGGDVAGGEPA